MSKVLTLLLTSFLRLAMLLFLQSSSLLMFLRSFIPLVSWGWFQAQSSSILGLFESHLTCLCLFHRILQAIQHEVKQDFCLRFDQIAPDLTDELAWYLFLLLPHWFLHYTWDGRSGQQKVFVHLRRFLASNWFSFLDKAFKIRRTTKWRTLNSSKDPNVGPSKKQRKKEESGHAPELTTLWGVEGCVGALGWD
jgi:hypothetical protein